MLEFRVFLDKKLIISTTISKGRVTIGRSSENDIVLQDNHISRLHVVIEQDSNEFRLYDRSSNGLLLDGRRVTDNALLPHQCRLDIYPFEIDCLLRNEDTTLPLLKKDIPLVQKSKENPLNMTSQPGATTYHFGMIVGESPRMKNIYQLIEDVANTTATVLIRGDHGTGKELVAQAIHEVSQRRGKPFIAVNCAAIPLDLVESELFGYEKGAFTGAQKAQKGKVEEADGGTLFLDEIGELSQAAQAKFLRFIQSKSFMRLGSARETLVDTRIVTATNKDLERSVKDGTFRADLYYRIKVVQIILPPLRERSEDIPLLIRHILQKLKKELNISSDPVITPEAINHLRNGKWPGNIRQLENVIYSTLIRSHPYYVIDEETLLSDSNTWSGTQDSIEESPIDTINKSLLIQVLKENHWDTSIAADILKVSRGTIYYKLKKYGIDIQALSRF